jgi:2',3'-cyclic-nucleotide 2'-phosphodiesterase (5'-nucleotidase family)
VTTTAVHILHTNDFHNALTEAGTGRLKDAIAGLNGAPYLLLDAGDAIGAGNVGVNPFGEPILERMSDAGYHAMTMGNREFHFLHRALETKIGRARFPVLCANVRPRRDNAYLPVHPWREFDIGGVRVTVFGLTVPMITERMKVAAFSSFVFDDPVETAAALVPELRTGADLLVALTHIGLREDERLARTAPQIDLIVGGHSHVNLPTPEEINGTRIVQAGWHARHYGHVTVTLAGGGPPRIEGALHPLQEKKRR